MSFNSIVEIILSEFIHFLKLNVKSWQGKQGFGLNPCIDESMLNPRQRGYVDSFDYFEDSARGFVRIWGFIRSVFPKLRTQLRIPQSIGFLKMKKRGFEPIHAWIRNPTNPCPQSLPNPRGFEDSSNRGILEFYTLYMSPQILNNSNYT